MLAQKDRRPLWLARIDSGDSKWALIFSPGLAPFFFPAVSLVSVSVSTRSVLRSVSRPASDRYFSTTADFVLNDVHEISPLETFGSVEERADV